MMNEIDNPSHYNVNGFEVIEIIESFDLNYRVGNVIKYILRAGRKEDRLKDLLKAQWYLTREIENEKSKRQISQTSS